MSRANSKPAAEPDPRKDGLTHNPFAALRSARPELSSAPPSSDASPKTNDLDARPDAKSATRVTTRERVPTRERVTVRRERSGRGGKAVTIAEGPGLHGHDVEALARDAARALGTGARVENGALVAQGDQSDRLVAWLTARGFASVARGN